jgi:hypothetical protein
MAEKKDEFLEQMKKQYDELNYRWSRERDEFEADLQHLSADAKKEYEAKREEYRKFRSELEGQITDLEAAGEHAWVDLKDGAEHAWESMSSAFSKAASHFKK